MAQENLKPLKTLVFSMGFLLIGGTVLLGVMTWKKLAARNAACVGGEIDLKGHGSIVSSQMDGRTIRLTLKKGAGKSEMVQVDSCTAKVISSVVIEAD
jgi:hypothetical protein